MFALFCLSIFFCVLWATLPEIKLMMMITKTGAERERNQLRSAGNYRTISHGKERRLE